MLEALAVFALSAVSDFAWTMWSRATSTGRSQLAGLSSVGIVLISGGITLAFVSNPWMLIPNAIGAYVGTVLAMKL